MGGSDGTYASGKRSQNDILSSIDATGKQNLAANKAIAKRTSAENISKMGVQAVAEIYGTGREALDVIGGAVENEGSKINQSLQKIRETFGGMGRDIDFEYMAGSASSAAMRRFMIMSDTYSERSNKAIMGSVQTGKDVLDKISDRGNILEALLGDPTIAFAKSEAILNDLSTKFGDEIDRLSDESVVKMAFYEDSLKTNAGTLQKIFQKQIGFQGEISTDSLDKLGAYAANLSNQLNIPMTALTKMTTEMMSNTQMFGDITVEEATRMSAKLSQLGVSMDQLNQQSQKFGSFQGAAQAAGTIAQLTGAQVDAMKMSFLTSEGRFDELIEYQRESLLKAGFTKEKFLSQSNSMRNAIADSFGRSQEEMAILLDSNRRISSQEELDAIMKEGDVAVEDGFDQLLNNIDQTKLALMETDELIAAQAEKAKMQATEGVVKAMEQKAKINQAQLDALQVVANDINVERIESSLKAVGDLYAAIDPTRFLGTAEDLLEALTTKAEAPGGFFHTWNAKMEEFERLQAERDGVGTTTETDSVTPSQNASGVMRGLLTGAPEQNTSPTLNQTFQITVERDGETFVKTMVYDAAGKLIQESEEKIQAELNKKVDKSEP